MKREFTEACVAYASRVLVAAFRGDELLPEVTRQGNGYPQRKLVALKQRDQHARGRRYTGNHCRAGDVL